MLTDIQKINGCLLGGAIGDAFGAPVEGLMKLSAIRTTFGQNGLQEFTHYKSVFDDAEHQGIGIITDDTTMMACTLAGMIDTVKADNVSAQLCTAQWQYYLAWGSHQTYGQAINAMPQMPVTIPDYIRPFLFICGAGRGTIAGLLQGEFGTFAKPLEYDMIVGDRLVQSPNRGCGAMMRIAPLGFMAPEYDVVALAQQNAVMTHGHDDAINTAAITAKLVEYAWQYGDIGKALAEGYTLTKTLLNNDAVLAAWQMAEDAHKMQPDSMDEINALGYRFKPQNPFTALPIFTQVIYTLYQAATYEPHGENFKKSIRLAVNHAGDSDSVGAIAGNIIGAAWGQNALPQDWVDLVMCKDDILRLGHEWHKATQTAQSVQEQSAPLLK